MVESAEVIDLSSRRRTLGHETHARSEPDATIFRAQVRTQSQFEPDVAKREITISELYSVGTPSSALINRAIELLTECGTRASRAQALMSAGDALGADLQISHLQSDLPELFCCKSLSDGLGAVTLAVHYALINRQSAPLSANQIFAVRRCIDVLVSNPFLRFEESLDLVESLADAELNTDPPEAETLGELFA